MSENRETFSHPIDVVLTEEEINAIKDRNMNIDRKRFEIMNEKAAANAAFGEELKALKKEQLALLEAETSGKAKREFQCYQERDDRRGMMLTMRCDNGDIVDERALTAEERDVPDDRQGSLFDGSAPAGDIPSDDEDDAPGDADADAVLSEYIAQGGAGDEEGDDDAGEEAHH